MREMELEEMGLALGGPLDATLDQVLFPPVGKVAEIWRGTPDEVVMQLTEIVKKKKG